MCPVIEVSDATFRQLQELAVPFVDTPETVIIRALDMLRASSNPRPQIGPARPIVNNLPPGTHTLDPHNPGELKHTKVLQAHFGSRSADKWNELLVEAHAEARDKLGSFELVKAASQSSLMKGERKESGFHHQKGLGFSIQYVDSNKAWQQVLCLAKRLGVAVEVQFRWRDKDGARRPGEFGVLRWNPSHSVGSVAKADDGQ